jgi:hypothetical protein
MKGQEKSMKEIVKKVAFQKPIDADKITIGRDHYFANAYIIDLPLDSTPDHVWLDMFEREWKSSRHLWDRKLFVMGDKLRLVTTEDDFEEKLNWIKQVIEQTNRDIDEYAESLKMEKKLEKRTLDIEQEKANVETIRDVLRKRVSGF